MPLEIRVDHSTCRGAQACVRRAPGTFSLGPEGKSVVAERPAEPETVVREAAASCPFFAIQVTETARR